MLARSRQRHEGSESQGVRIPRQLKSHALTLWMLGEHEGAIEKMREAIDYGWSEIYYMKNNPVMDQMRWANTPGLSNERFGGE
jgi:hypothetical protein